MKEVFGEEHLRDCLKVIDLYEERKENNMFDDFYRSHLHVFRTLIEERLQELTFSPVGYLRRMLAPYELAAIPEDVLIALLTKDECDELISRIASKRQCDYEERNK